MPAPPAQSVVSCRPVVIGGLFSSTFLTLLVIPAIYSLVDGGRTGASGLGRKPAEGGVATPPPPASPPEPAA